LLNFLIELELKGMKKLDSKSFIFLLLILAVAAVAFYLVWTNIQTYLVTSSGI